MPTTTRPRPAVRPSPVPGFTLATLAGRIALRLMGDGVTSTAAGNAWQAVQADREHAAERDRLADLFARQR